MLPNIIHTLTNRVEKERVLGGAQDANTILHKKYGILLFHKNYISYICIIIIRI
jgi:hypothetical protein